MRILGGLSSRLGTMGEVVGFLWARKLYWLVPMVLVLMVFGILLALASTTGIAPFIYSLI